MCKDPFFPKRSELWEEDDEPADDGNQAGNHVTVEETAEVQTEAADESMNA